MEPFQRCKEETLNRYRCNSYSALRLFGVSAWTTLINESSDFITKHINKPFKMLSAVLWDYLS